MNRRSFLAALGLSPVAAVTAAALPAEEVAVQGMEATDFTLASDAGDSIPFTVSQSGEVFIQEARSDEYRGAAYPTRTVLMADGSTELHVFAGGAWHAVWESGFA